MRLDPTSCLTSKRSPFNQPKYFAGVRVNKCLIMCPLCVYCLMWGKMCASVNWCSFPTWSILWCEVRCMLQWTNVLSIPGAFVNGSPCVWILCCGVRYILQLTAPLSALEACVMGFLSLFLSVDSLMWGKMLASVDWCSFHTWSICNASSVRVGSLLWDKSFNRLMRLPHSKHFYSLLYWNWERGGGIRKSDGS